MLERSTIINDLSLMKNTYWNYKSFYKVTDFWSKLEKKRFFQIKKF